jgi:tRNA threonylcarbamoyl adenosine modification protein YeaZ
MRILAVDTALGLCSASVYDAASGAVLSVESQLMERGHAEALMPLIERVMAKVEGGFASLDRVAASIGPGSFTGLRVGLSAARAIAVALDIPVVGIDTLSAFAAPCLDEGESRLIASVIDARHNHVYFKLTRPDGTALVEPAILPIGQAAASFGSQPVRLVGSAPALLAEQDRTNAQWIVDPAIQGPDPVWIARLGAAADPARALPSPLYLRPPDALPQTNGRIALA